MNPITRFFGTRHLAVDCLHFLNHKDKVKKAKSIGKCNWPDLILELSVCLWSLCARTGCSEYGHLRTVFREGHQNKQRKLLIAPPQLKKNLINLVTLSLIYFDDCKKAWSNEYCNVRSMSGPRFNHFFHYLLDLHNLKVFIFPFRNMITLCIFRLKESLGK